MKKSPQVHVTPVIELLSQYYTALGEIEYNIHTLEQKLAECYENKQQILRSINSTNEISHIYKQTE